MRTLIILTFLLFTGLTLFAQYNNQQSAALDRNKILTIRTSYVLIQQGTIKVESCNNQLIILDEKGRASKQIGEVLNKKNGTLYEYHYNKCGELDTLNQYDVYNGIQKLDERIISLYDDSCRPIKTLSKDAAGNIIGTQTTNQYNSYGKKILETTAEDGKITTIINFNYGDKYVEEKASFPNGVFWYHHQKFFDDKGNPIKSIDFTAAGKKDEETIVYDYNNNGNITTEKHYDNSGKLKYIISNEYNSDNLLEQSITKSQFNPEPYEIITTNYYSKRE